MFEKIETNIPGCFIIKPRIFSDDRGDFVKLLHSDLFKELGLESDFKEEYYSTSSKGVVRGLHFQTPPDEHAKCVVCLNGEVFDAVVDLRKNSPTYGKYFTVTLKASEPTIFYVPAGLAHGFVALTDNVIFLNKTTTVYSPDCDGGIHWQSCGIEWPEMPYIVSEKDKNMPFLDSFSSPF